MEPGQRTVALLAALVLALTPAVCLAHFPDASPAWFNVDGPPRLEAPERAPDVPQRLHWRTPADQLRPIGPETHPYTTDRGWFQVEFTPLDFAYDRDGAQRIRSFAIPVLIKYGLTDNIDVQVGIETYACERWRDRDTRHRETDRGFGDVLVASKVNLWGNDTDGSALAVMPFLLLPTARHDMGSRAVQAGASIPTFLPLIEDLGLEFTPFLAAVRNTRDDGYVAGYGQNTTLSWDVFGHLAAFVEFESSWTSQRGTSWQAMLGTGLSLGLGEHTVIEAGVGFGLNRATDDVTVYVTLVRRF